MSESQERDQRRKAISKIVYPVAIGSAWASPIVQSILLPAHAQMSQCTRGDVVGRWQLELMGVAASSREITFFDDGALQHAFLNQWQFSNDTLQITQGFTWLLSGTFSTCDALSGTYVNTFVNPIIGNVIVRRGDWVAQKLS